MLLDKRLIFEDNFALRAATKKSEVVDLNVGHQVGIGNPVYLIVQINAGLTGATAGQFTLHTNATATAGRTAGAEIAQISMTQAQVRAQTRMEVIIPPAAVLERYLHVDIAVGANPTAGSLSIWLSNKTEGYQTIKSGFTVQ